MPIQDRFKCRVWDKNAKKYLTPYVCDEKAHMHSQWIGWDNTGVYQYDRDTERDIVFVTDITEFVDIEQSIGAKDIEGKLIYEGDILLDSLGEKCVVKYSECDACHVIEKEDELGFRYKQLPDWDNYEYEVIGNIRNENVNANANVKGE